MHDLLDTNRFTDNNLRCDQPQGPPRRISTLELLSLARSQNLSKTSASSESLKKWRAHHSLLVQESRLSRLRARLKRCTDKILPKTINDIRLSVQWTVALLLSSIPLYLHSVHSVFRGSEVFIPLSAVLTYDPTYGGHIRKLIDRLTCSFAAIILALLLVAPVFLAKAEEESWVHWLIYGGSCIVPFFWSYAKALYPTHPTVPYAGITASISFFEINRTGHELLRAMLFVFIATVIGSLIGSMVYFLVLPRRARSIIQIDLANALGRVALILTPLVEIEAGLVQSPSFFKKSSRSATLLKKVSRSRTFRSISSMASASKAGCRMEMADVEYAIFEEFRDNLWNKVDEVNKLLAAQRPLLRPAEREYSATKPHKFPSEQYLNLFENIRRIFFHVVSLYITLDAKTIVLGLDESCNDVDEYANQLDQWAGSSVRIRSKAAVSRQYPLKASLNRFLIPPSSLDFHTSNPSITHQSALCSPELPERRLSSRERPHELMPHLTVQDSSIDLHLEECARIPLMKWANTYGPLIGQTCHSIVECLKEISESLRTTRKSQELANCGRRALQAMWELTELRLKGQLGGQWIYDEVMRRGKGDKSGDYISWKKDVQRRIDANVMSEIIGVSCSELKNMSRLERTVVWNSFQSCIDRLTTVGRVLLALTLELERCIANLNTFLDAMSGTEI